MTLVTLDAPRGRNTGLPSPEFPLGLYVHIPFCVRKCHYCDFAAGPAPGHIRRQYVDVLIEEIRRSPLRGQAARTVYFGGGTPSELSSEELHRITEALRETFALSPGPGFGDQGSGAEPGPQSAHMGAFRNPHSEEWSIECNPGTVTVESISAMRRMGFNRISLGLQTFFGHHLKALGRIHTAPESVEAIEAARAAGVARLNLDLIFCLPGQTLDEWKSDVDRALSFRPQHVSLYNLTIEEQTEFGRRHRAGLLPLPDEDLSADMYEWAIDHLDDAGFCQYEVSNFARPGEECRHNQIYWRQEPYVGFGVGAASYLGGRRWSNTRSMQRYLRSAATERGTERAWDERLEPLAAAGEAMMLGLRTRDGVDLEAVGARHGIDAESAFGPSVRELAADGLLLQDENRWKLTRRGVLLANAVCIQFLVD